MNSHSLTKGSIGKSLLFFLLPILTSSLIQQLYSTVDLIFVGRFCGTESTAAIGASNLIITCLIGFFNGMAVGTNVVAAHIYGEENESDLKKVINKLAKTEYIISSKGRNGGLKLGMDPAEINLGKVLLLTEENLSLVECMGESGTCPLLSKECKLKGIICKSLNVFVNEMAQYTLKDIM
mgnify:CR=1 FL=1